MALPVISSTWKFFRTVFFTLASLTLFLLLVFEINGLPQSLLLGFRQSLQKQGLNFRVQDIKAGLINGINVSNVVIFDPDNNEHLLFKAESVQLNAKREDLLLGKLNLKFIEFKNSQFNFILRSPQEEIPMTFDQLNFRASLKGQDIVIEKCTARWDGFKVEVTGLLKNVIEEKTAVLDKQKIDFKLFSLYEFNRYLSPDNKRQIAHFIHFYKSLKLQEMATCQINFSFDKENPDESTIKLVIQTPLFEYNNTPLKARLEASLLQGIITVDSLQLQLEDNAFIHITGMYLPLFDRVQATITGQCKILKTLKTFVPELAAKLHQFKESDKSSTFTIKLAPSPLKNPALWNLRTRLSLNDVTFNKLRFLNLDGDFKIYNKVISSEHITFTADQLSGSAAINIDINKDSLTLDAQVRGLPANIHHFIASPVAVKNYLDIWKDFEWDETALPHFGGILQLNDISKPKVPVKVKSKLWFKVAGATYRGVRTQKISAKVKLALPKALRVEDIKVNFTGGEANVNLHFPGPQIGTDILLEGNFTTDIRTTLKMISPEWETELPFLKFPASSKTSVKAIIKPQKPQDSELTADIELPSLQCWNLNFENVKTKLMLKNRHLVFEAKDFDENIRSLQFTAKKVHLGALLARVSDTPINKTSGVLDATLDIKLVDPGKESSADIAIEGNGELTISEGNFWQVPIFAEFMNNIDSLLPLNSSGKIQSLNADLIFKDHTIKTSKFLTDGSLIALSGDGTYDWLHNTIDYNVNTHYLKKILAFQTPFAFDLLSPIFTPLSLVMKGHLSGTPDKWSWKLQNIKKATDFISDIPKALLYPIRKIFNLDKKKK